MRRSVLVVCRSARLHWRRIPSHAHRFEQARPTRDPRPRPRPARRRHLRDDGADDAARGRPGRRSATAAVLRHRRPRRVRRRCSPRLPARRAGALAGPRAPARPLRLRARHGRRLSALSRPGAAPGRRDARRGRHRRAAARRPRSPRRSRCASAPRQASGPAPGSAAPWSSASPSGRAAALALADVLLLGAVASAAVGYVAGARLSAEMPAERVICWVLVLSLPADRAGDARDLAGPPGEPAGVGRLRLRHGVLDVAGLLRLVPRPRARRHGAGQPGPAGPALPGHAVRRAGARRAARRGDRRLRARRRRHRLRRPGDAGRAERCPAAVTSPLAANPR